ncbi:MAG: type II toxin-antitoxin system VapC family toxin [Cyanobacteria bacterium REEB67]|nr:type II toxin-antitoxin system VapC family toxin [Cyanobacteria bacterium REEB67]
MMSNDRLLAFVDCNIVIECLFAPMHPANAIAVLAANKHLDLVTCNLVIEDIEAEIIDRATQADDLGVIDVYAQFLKQIRLKVMPDPTSSLVKETLHKYLGIMRHRADIPVLASAIEIGPNLILSDNRKHFNDLVAERSGIPICSSEEFLALLMSGSARERLGSKS